MCVPVAVGLAVAAAAAQIGGQITSGIAQKQQMNAAARVSDNNVRIANDQARDSIEATNIEAQRLGRQTAQLKGQQIASMAAGGVDLNVGSAVDVQRDTAMIAAEDVTQLYKAGAARTRTAEVQAWNYRGEAAMQRAKGKAAMTGAIFGSISTALGAASQITKR